MKNIWIKNRKPLPSFIRMYEHKSYDEPIPGILAKYTSVNYEYKFGDRDGRIFHLNLDNSDHDCWQRWSAQHILEIMKSQLQSTDQFDFVIDEEIVKAVVAKPISPMSLSHF